MILSKKKKINEPYEIAPLTPIPLENGKNKKQTAKNMYQKLNAEVQGKQLLEAGIILTKHNPQTTIQRFGDMHITINKETGKIRDRSQIGISLSTKTKDIYYGIGYFQTEYAESTKSYFIEITSFGRKKMILIPLQKDGAGREFFETLKNFTDNSFALAA